MIVELRNADGETVEQVETHNVEVSDDLRFNVDHLRGANDELPEEVSEISIKVPE